MKNTSDPVEFRKAMDLSSQAGAKYALSMGDLLQDLNEAKRTLDENFRDLDAWEAFCCVWTFLHQACIRAKEAKRVRGLDQIKAEYLVDWNGNGQRMVDIIEEKRAAAMQRIHDAGRRP